jgi:peroxiredoxin
MSNYIEVAKQFGNLIAKSNYVAAHALLTKEAQTAYSPDDFKESVEHMIAYDPGPIQSVEVMKDFILTDWPKKQDGDVAIVYVALGGGDFCEAVTVTLVQVDGDLRIRDLEWGRP